MRVLRLWDGIRLGYTDAMGFMHREIYGIRKDRVDCFGENLVLIYEIKIMQRIFIKNYDGFMIFLHIK